MEFVYCQFLHTYIFCQIFCICFIDLSLFLLLLLESFQIFAEKTCHNFGYWINHHHGLCWKLQNCKFRKDFVLLSWLYLESNDKLTRFHWSIKPERWRQFIHISRNVFHNGGDGKDLTHATNLNKKIYIILITIR